MEPRLTATSLIRPIFFPWQNDHTFSHKNCPGIAIVIHFLCRTLNHETRLYRHPVNTAKFLWPVVGRINHIPPGGGGGGVGKCPRRLQLWRTFLIFMQYLPNVATFTKIYWRTRFWKNFASRISHVAMATAFSKPCLLKF